MWEYVFALDPNQRDFSEAGPTLTSSEGIDEFAFTLASPVGPDVLISIEMSTDLANWAIVATRASDGSWTGNVTEIPSAPGKTGVALEHPSTFPRQFYRLRATLVP